MEEKKFDNLVFFDNSYVYCLAYTKLSQDLYNYLIDFNIDYNVPDISNTAESLIEIAGKHCYMSFGKGRKSIQEYINGIIEHKHFSVIEHLSATFVIRGVSRYFTHEFVRHRHNSYSQFSTRYCDPIGFVIPYDFRISQDDTKEIREIKSKLIEQYKQKCINSYEYYLEIKKQLKNLIEEKNELNKRKRIRGTARFGLLSGMEAPIVVTGNLRSWLEYLQKRLPNGKTGFPDPEIAEVSVKIFENLRKIFPITMLVQKEISNH